ncbi:MAG: WD40 repeat domain-containing protein [Chloroflexota bacterium]
MARLPGLLLIVCLLLLTAGAPAGAAAQPAPVISPANAAGLQVVQAIAYDPWTLVNAAAWSPDGARLAVSAGDAIYIYNTGDWSQQAVLPVGALTQGLAYSPDGAWLASAGRDGRVRVWEGETQRLSLEAHRKGANRVAFSPDGRVLASGGNDAVARFWDPLSGARLGLMIGGSYAVPGIAFLPDGAALAVINGDRLRLRQVGSERILGSFAAEAGLYSVALSPDGRLLAVGGNDNLVRLWDPQTAFRSGVERYPEPQLLVGHAGRPGTFRALIWQVDFSPDGRLLASAGGDGTLRVWEIGQAAQLAVLSGHPCGATCVVFSPDGRRLASGGLDGRLLIWAP